MSDWREPQERVPRFDRVEDGVGSGLHHQYRLGGGQTQGTVDSDQDSLSQRTTLDQISVLQCGRVVGGRFNGSGCSLNFAQLNYFAFVSLTTMGFGNLIPMTAPASMVCVKIAVEASFDIEAVMGGANQQAHH